MTARYHVIGFGFGHREALLLTQLQAVTQFGVTAIVFHFLFLRIFRSPRR